MPCHKNVTHKNSWTEPSPFWKPVLLTLQLQFILSHLCPQSEKPNYRKHLSELCSTQYVDSTRYIYTQRCSYGAGARGQVTTTPPPHRNCELKKVRIIEFVFSIIWILLCEKKSLPPPLPSTYVAAHWTSVPGMAAPFIHSRYTPGYVQVQSNNSQIFLLFNSAFLLHYILRNAAKGRVNKMWHTDHVLHSARYSVHLTNMKQSISYCLKFGTHEMTWKIWVFHYLLYLNLNGREQRFWTGYQEQMW